MTRLISRCGAVPGMLVASICCAVPSEPPAARIHERLILAAADEDRAKAEKKRQQEREELRKKQKAEHDAREERRKKEMAERQAREAERRKELQRRSQDAHRGKDGDKSRAGGGNVSQPKAPPPASVAAPKMGINPPQQPAPGAPVVAPVAPPQKSAPPPVATAPGSPLVVRTYPASGIRLYANGPGATLNGYANYPGKNVRVWFEWGDTPSFGQGATESQLFTGERSVGHGPVVFPARNKRYYYRMVAESSGLLVNGETLSFITP